MKYTYIADNNELEHCIACLSESREFAIDLEFDKNRYRYGFNLCLIQVYTGHHCFLIDPLSKNLETALIFPVLENPGIQKVVFSFGEDLRLLHSLDCFPKNMFDLSIITSLLNFAPLSLANLLKEVLHVEVEKSSQQSNWFKRPLTEKQLNYAADDVLYLLKLKEALMPQAEKSQIMNWVIQENELLEMNDYSAEKHNALLKEKDKKDMTVFEWHIFSGLMELTDNIAQKLNKPVHHLIDKEYVYELAKNPTKITRWDTQNGIFRKLKAPVYKNKFKNVIEESVAEAEQMGLSKTKKAYSNLSKEEYALFREKQREHSRLKTEIFVPIQEKIKKEFGQNVQSFILSNRHIKEMLNNEIELPEYKKTLFRNYASELGIDISSHLSAEKKAS